VLFSATMPPALKTVMASVMTKDYGVVDCINDGDAATATNAQVLVDCVRVFGRVCACA